MFYLFALIFTFSSYCATNNSNIPHILLIEDEKYPAFNFLIHQARPDPNRYARFPCCLPAEEMKKGQEDQFPVEYTITYFSESFNEGCRKESHKRMHRNTFYDDFIRGRHFDQPHVLTATGNNCQLLFSYLNSTKDFAHQIRCICIHNPTVSKNANITRKYKKGLLKKLPCAKKLIKKVPHLNVIIPLVHELVSKLSKESYDAFKREIIYDVNDIASSSSFCTTPFVITYDKNFADDALALYEILLNDNFKNIKDPVLLLDSSDPEFQIMINNIISIYYKPNLFDTLMQKKNNDIINSGISKKTQKKLAYAQWFASKTPLQRFIIRRIRDALLLTLLLFCYKTIRFILRFI